MPRFTRLAATDRRLMLIEAAVLCMAEGGLVAFTVDRICARAGVSRGLITHHFGSIAGLMAATYAHLYDEDIPQPGPHSLQSLFASLFDPAKFNRPRLNTWLALWSAIANSPELTAEHRSRYAGYRAQVAAALQAEGAPESLAPALIALIDGLSLQQCIDPESMPPEAARSACEAFLAPHLRKTLAQSPQGQPGSSTPMPPRA